MELLGGSINVFSNFIFKVRHLCFGVAIAAGLTALSRSFGLLTTIPDKEAVYIYLLGIVCASTWAAIIAERLLQQHREKREHAQKVKSVRESVREDMNALEGEHRVALRWLVRHDKQQVLENRRPRVLEDLAGLNILEDGATRSRYKYRVPDWIWNELKQQKWSALVPGSVRRSLDSEVPPWHQELRARI